MRLSRIAVLIMLTTLVGCSDGPPYGFPDADDSARMASNSQCPNLDGT
jgi:predicted small lipoprotein YifL